jgi:hypothetical protein
VWSSIILGASCAFLAAGPAAFGVSWLTGSTAWVEFLFQVPGTLLLVGLALAATAMSAAVCRHFAAGELLRPAWMLIAAAAAFDAAGLVCTHILGVRTVLNPLAAVPNVLQAAGVRLRDGGMVMSGPCRLALLAAGLAFALRAYRSAGFLGRLEKLDRLLVAGAGAYVLREAWDTAAAVRRGASVTVAGVLMWPVDPLLLLLLLEALLLLRSAQGMGDGRIGRTWRAFSTGIFLLVLGDFGLWATAYGHLPWPWSSITWYVWVPAAAAFALAPARQLAAIYRAEKPGS